MKNIEVYKNYKDLPKWVKGMRSQKDFFKWLDAECPALDKEEKVYIRNFVLPFYDDVVSITKYHSVEGEGNSCLCFELVDTDSIWDDTYDFNLPIFKDDSMYIGMEYDREYTLTELGIKK